MMMRKAGLQRSKEIDGHHQPAIWIDRDGYHCSLLTGRSFEVGDVSQPIPHSNNYMAEDDKRLPVEILSGSAPPEPQVEQSL